MGLRANERESLAEGEERGRQDVCHSCWLLLLKSSVSRAKVIGSGRLVFVRRFFIGAARRLNCANGMVYDNALTSARYKTYPFVMFCLFWCFI